MIKGQCRFGAALVDVIVHYFAIPSETLKAVLGNLWHHNCFGGEFQIEARYLRYCLWKCCRYQSNRLVVSPKHTSHWQISSDPSRWNHSSSRRWITIHKQPLRQLPVRLNFPLATIWKSVQGYRLIIVLLRIKYSFARLISFSLTLTHDCLTVSSTCSDRYSVFSRHSTIKIYNR